MDIKWLNVKFQNYKKENNSNSKYVFIQKKMGFWEENQ